MTARAAGRVGWGLAAATAAMFSVFVALGGDTNPFSAAAGFAAILSFSAAGAVVVGRDPGHRLGWLLCVAATVVGIAAASGAYAQKGDADWPARAAVDWLSEVCWIGGIGLPVVFLGLLLPDGRLPSPRWRPAGIAAAATLATGVLATAFARWTDTSDHGEIANPAGLPYANGLLAAVGFASVGIILVGFAAVAVRYRTGTAVERQQLKWIGAGLVGTLGFGLLDGLATRLVPGYTGAPEWVGLLTWTFLPASLAVAMVRYRLYGIDVIIRRTLIYAMLATALAACYLTGVALIGAVLRSLTGQSGTVAVTASTLATAAAFQPLRSRIQRVVERRFARERYDAERALAALTSRLRDGVELEAVRADVLGLVEATMRPRTASLWLRETGADR